MFNWAASASGEPVSCAAAGSVHMHRKSIRVGDDQHQCCPSPLLPRLDPFEDLCFSIKCSPGHSSSLLLLLLSASVLSPGFLLCLSVCLSEIGGRLWSSFKIGGVFFRLLLYPPHTRPRGAQVRHEWRLVVSLPGQLKLTAAADA